MEGTHDLWHAKLAAGIGPFFLSSTLHQGINDGLMVIFFFVVGLEIKHEVLAGELASLRKAMFPICAAIGGMVFPAAIYAGFNLGKPEISGWGVPMATDIAFALGILALLGDRVPLALKVFLTALAIVDDLGAVLVIAVFYTSELNLGALRAGFGVFVVMAGINKAGVRSPLVYFLFAVALWLCFLKSGVHATIAGVLAAMTIPARTLVDEDTFLSRLEFLTARIRNAEGAAGTHEHNIRVRELAGNLAEAAKHAQSPLQRLEHSLHPWQAFVIMPVFALANAGLPIGAESLELMTETTSLGVIAGLIVGKPLGVTLCSWLAVKAGLASLPASVAWTHVHAVGWLAGIGFTMSLFIDGLAFQNEAFLTMGKTGILTGSLIAGIGGFLLLRKALRPDGGQIES